MKLKALIVLVMIAMISCKEKVELNPPYVVSHPMIIGTEWTYNRQVLITKYESETSDNKLEIDTLNFVVKVWIDKDTIFNNDLSVKVFKVSDDGWHWKNEYKYLDEEGLKTYAYSTSGNADVFGQKYSFLKSSMATNELIDGGLKIESPPTLDIKFPLNLSSTWTYRSPSEAGELQIDKTVVGYERIKVNERYHNCYKVEWKYLNDPLFNGIKVTDWISDNGLIKRLTINERVTLVPEVEEPLFNGNIQIIEVLTLELLEFL